MDSITEPAAHALAFRWGELREEPPAYIDDLMTDLTEALAEAEQAGDKARANCLDGVLDALAQGIAKHERRSGQDFDGETLESAIAEIRAYYCRESSLRGAGEQDAVARRTEQPEGKPLQAFSSRPVLSSR